MVISSLEALSSSNDSSKAVEAIHPSFTTVTLTLKPRASTRYSYKSFYSNKDASKSHPVYDLLLQKLQTLRPYLSLRYLLVHLSTQVHANCIHLSLYCDPLHIFCAEARLSSMEDEQIQASTADTGKEIRFLYQALERCPA